MKRQRKNLSLPAIKKFREAIANGNIGTFLINQGESTNAGSVAVKYDLKNRPWTITIKAKRRYGNN